MQKTEVKTHSRAELRRLAVERLHVKQGHALRVEPTPDRERLIQELQVHQIELEMQNEELRSVRDELEVALARSTELYDFAPAGYVTLDASSTILEINLAGAAMLGKERARIIGQRFAPCVAAAARPAWNDFLGRLREGSEQATCEVALATHGDEELNVRIDGMREPAVQGRDWRCRAVMSDISLHKRLEQALRKHRTRLALRYNLTSALSSAPRVADVARVVFEKGLVAFGADAGALALADEQEGGMLQIVAQFGCQGDLTGAQRCFPAELASPLTDAYRTGAAVWVESSAEALSRYPKWAADVSSGTARACAGMPLKVDGRTFGGIGLGFRHERAFDDEDRAFMESLADRCAQAFDRARLLESERRLRVEAERIGELQRLTLGVVGHDLRSPLQAIKMSAAILVQKGDLSSAQAERVVRITRGADRIAAIIRDLLDYTRARQGETLPVDRRDIDLNELCRTIVLEAQSIHPDRDIAFDSSGSCPGAWDATRLGQVISNLLSNALDHGGRACRVRVALAADEAAATITVFNDGTPIPREVQTTIFQPYRRGEAGERKAGSGLGLGLFIVREIARAHGGDVAVESTEAGTSFTVRLPRGPA